MTRLSPALLLTALGAAAAAQQTPETADAPTETPEWSAPSVNCTPPKIPQRASVAQEDIQYLERQANAYGECIKRYVAERQAQSQRYSSLAKAEADAGNAAVAAYNDFLAQVKALEAKNKH